MRSFPFQALLLLLYYNDFPDWIKHIKNFMFVIHKSIHDFCQDTTLKAPWSGLVAQKWIKRNEFTVTRRECEESKCHGKTNRKSKWLQKSERQNWSKTNSRDHMEHVIGRLNKRCGHIYKKGDPEPIKSLRSFYHAFANWVFAYGLIETRSKNIYNYSPYPSEKAQGRNIQNKSVSRNWNRNNIFSPRTISQLFVKFS